MSDEKAPPLGQYVSPNHGGLKREKKIIVQ